MLIETDSPYLAPIPYRGKRNEPSFVVRVAETVAGLRGVGTSDLAAMCTANAETFFGIAPMGGR